ncbi:MAG: biotin--[acetyl-CoA-carboxylase] ligase [bacterium]
MDRFYPLIGILCDGRFHSGEELAAEFNLSRSAIWKQLKQLEQETGLSIDSVRGRGYRIAGGLELLNRESLMAHLEDHHVGCLEMVQILSATASTNDYLLENQESMPVGSGAVCLAEYQSAGKGRRGRPWVSVFGRNVMLSLSWRFQKPLSQLSGLSLAIGAAIAAALKRLGVEELVVKWPNDLHVERRKLAGILIEATGDFDAPSTAVIGLGLNISQRGMGEIDQPWISLSEILPVLPERNLIAATVLGAMIEACKQFDEQGIAGFLGQLEAFDGYRGKQVALDMVNKTVIGRYMGIDNSGGVVIDSEGRKQVFHGGEISFRVNNDEIT